MKKQNGITLIALVITIIVMLILVAVTISIVLDGGIISKTQEAKISSDEAQIQEEVEMVLAAVASNHPGEALSSTIVSELQTELRRTDGTATSIFTSGTAEVLYKGKIFTISGNYQINKQDNTPSPSTPTNEEFVAREEESFYWTIIPDSVNEGKYIITGYSGPLENVTVPHTIVKDETTFSVSQFGDGQAPVLYEQTVGGERQIMGPADFLGTLTIADGLKIGLNALPYQPNLTAIVIGNNCEMNNGFSGCTGLTNLTIGTNAVIGENAFNRNMGCFANTGTELGTITINGPIRSIGNYAFYQQIAQINITEISEGITVGEYAFSGCTGLTNLTIGTNASIEGYAFAGCTKISRLEIGSNVTIGDFGFYECGNDETITSLVVTIGDNVTIGEQGMLRATKLTSLTVGAGFTAGPEAFKYSFKDGMVTIGTGADLGAQSFAYPNSLLSVTLGTGYSIDDSTFLGCAQDIIH